MSVDNSNMKNANVVKILGTVNAALAFLFFMQLVISVRPASDDLQFVFTQNDLGFFEIIKYHYFYLTGRITNYALFGVLAKADLFSRLTIVTYYFLVFAALISGFYLMLKRALSLSESHAFFVSVLLFEVLYFLSPVSAESWFWLCASVSYLVPCVVFVFGFALQNSKLKFVNILTCVLFFYAGNSSENLSLTLLVAYFAYLKLYAYQTNNLKAVLINRNLISMLLGLFVNVFSIGNIRRFGLETELRIEQKGNFFDTLFSFVFQYDFYLAIILMGMLVLAFNKQISIVFSNVKTSSLLLLIGVLLFTSLAPLYFVFHSNYPLRTLTPLILPITLIVFLIAKEFSKYIKFDSSISLICAYGISIIVFSVLLLKNFEALKNYRNYYDERIAVINGHKNKTTKETLFLTKLPDPGRVTGTIEISTDTSNGNNKQWQKLLSLPFSIALKK